MQPQYDILDMVTREKIMQEERERLELLRKRWDRYTGTFPKPLKRLKDHPDDNVAVNKCAVIVDTGVSFLFGQKLTFNLDASRVRSTQEEYLDAIWEANRQTSFLQKVGINGGWAGHAFILLEPNSTILGGKHRLILQDPQTVTPYYRNGDIDDIYRWRIQYNDIHEDNGKPIIVRKLLDRAKDMKSWTILDQWKYASARDWQTTNEVVWNYAWPPMFHCQNLPRPNEFWGKSDLEDDVIHLNEVINLNMSMWMRTLSFHAYPRLWARGIGTGGVKLGPEDILELPGDNSAIGALEMKSDGAATLDMDRRLSEGLHQIAETPEIATGKVENVGQLSGTAIRVLYRPLIDRTETKRNTYGEMLSDINRALLELGGFGKELRPTIEWWELVPSDPLEEVQTAVMKEQVGFSKNTLIQQLGGDPELEKTQREQERQSLGETLLSQFDRGQMGNPDDGEV